MIFTFDYKNLSLGQIDKVNHHLMSIDISSNTWAPGIWVGMELAPIEVYDEEKQILKGDFNIIAIDLVTRCIYLDKPTINLSQNDIIFYKFK